MKKIIILILFVFVWILSAEEYHRVEKGDTLFSLAKKYNVTVDQICTWNTLVNRSIKIGQTLVLYPPKAKTETAPGGYKYYRVKKHETLWRIAYNHRIPAKVLIDLNNINDVSGVRSGQVIKIPSNAIETKTKETMTPIYGNIRLQRPVPGVLAQANSKNGININCREGEWVHAVMDGLVEYTGELVGYKNVVIVNHGNDLYSIYASLGSVKVEKGNQIKAGQVLGNVEKLAHYDYAFLYFELVAGGKYLNPIKYLN